MSRSTGSRQQRRDPLIFGVLLCIAVLLIILVTVMVLNMKGGTPAKETSAKRKRVAVQSGQKITRKEVDRERRAEAASDNQGDTSSKPEKGSTLPPPPKAIGNSRRIQEILQPGKTYQIISHIQLHCPVRSKDWGLETAVTLNYHAEGVIHRTIEKNDGHEIQELRYFAKCRVISLTSTVDVEFKPPSAAVVVLGLADAYFTGGETTAWLASVKPVAEDFLSTGVQALLNDDNAKAKRMVESFEGKKVRIVYRDGEGVVSLTPVDCTLTVEERDFLMGASLLTDAYMLPDIESKPGDTWDVPGNVFSDMVPPSWASTPQGVIRLQRKQDYESNGKKYARLEITGGTVHLDATDVSRRRVGRFTPSGYATYNITKGHVEEINGKGDFTVEEVSRDHFLFEYRFETSPTLRFTYHCKMLE